MPLAPFTYVMLLKQSEGGRDRQRAASHVALHMSGAEMGAAGR